MNVLAAAALLPGSALLSWALTLWLERNAGRLGLVQHANARSSHIRPTPTGGGAAIAIATLTLILLMAALGNLVLLPVAIGMAIVAALGFADDRWDLPAALRFSVQALVLGGMIWSAPQLPPLGYGPGLQLAGFYLLLAVLLAGLWWINLFNFMDGIDGMAASQAIILLLGSCLVWWSAGPAAPNSAFFWLAMVAAAATSGFLVRNWPPAHIFMGDAGSNALAFIIFAVAIHILTDASMAYGAWLILPAVFVADATTTLLRRTLRGEKPWQAHRRHAYQQLSRRWGHRRVTLLYGALSLLWALPMALWAQHHAAWTGLVLVLAYAPLIGFAVWAKAGAAEETA